MRSSFRQARQSDLPFLLQAMGELWAYDSIPFDRSRSERATLELLGDPLAGTVWVIESNELPVGYLVLTRAFSLEFGWHLFIDELFIQEPYRGLGIGSAAVEHAIGECRRCAAEALLLEAALSNERATRLYNRLGFREHPRRLMSVRISPDH